MPKIKRYKGVRQLPDGRFLVRYPDLGRKYHERILERHEAGTIETAIGILDDLKGKVQAGERPWERLAAIVPEPVTTFNMLADEWLNYSRIHLKAYTRDVFCLKELRKHFGEKDIREIAPADVEAFKQIKVDEGYGRPSVNHWLAMLRRVLNKAKSHGRLDSTPFPAVKLLKLEKKGRLKFLSPEEEALILHHAEGWLRPVITFSLHTGLRLGETARLTRQDVDLEKRIIYVEHTKSGKPRAVPMNDTVHALLSDALKVHFLDDDRIFRHCGSFMSHRFTLAVRDLAAKVAEARNKGAKFYRIGEGEGAERIDLEKVTLDGVVWHSLRHTWASRLVMAGVPIKTLMELGGWSSLEMVEVYAHIGDEHKAEAVKRLDVYSGDRICVPKVGTMVAQAPLMRSSRAQSAQVRHERSLMIG
ncbi:MAG: site-specific integrase [Nitrospirae bacterium]|nr:site-specific integrase [Nitrospirota bacterium]